MRHNARQSDDNNQFETDIMSDHSLAFRWTWVNFGPTTDCCLESLDTWKRGKKLLASRYYVTDQGWFTLKTQTSLQAMFTRPTQTHRYARTFGHSNIADEVELLVAFSVLILGLWLIMRKRGIQEHRIRRPKPVCVREIFPQRKLQGVPG